MVENLDSVMAKAAQGEAAAQLMLARAFGTGRGIRQDFVQAFDWCQKAAAQQHPEAMYILSESYRQGLGVAKDPVAAQQWRRKAILAGYQPNSRTNATKANQQLAGQLVKTIAALIVISLVLILLLTLAAFSICTHLMPIVFQFRH